MYLLGGLPRELIKQLHLLNLKEPTDVRDYLVKYEQLDSYLPPLEESAKVTTMAPMQPNPQNQPNQGASGQQRQNNNQANNAVVPYNSQQANRGRGNNNNFRGRGNNRANYQQWNRVDSQ
jgi:hypothetical protein